MVARAGTVISIARKHVEGTGQMDPSATHPELLWETMTGFGIDRLHRGGTNPNLASIIHRHVLALFFYPSLSLGADSSKC